MPRPRLLSLLIPLLLVLPFTAWKTRNASHPDLHGKYSVTELRQDLDQMVAIIKKNHPSLYDFNSETNFNALVKQAQDAITDSMELIPFYKIISPIVTSIGCGHTQLWLPGWLWQDSALPVLPVRLFFERDKTYILNNYGSNKNLQPGAEVIAINGHPIAEIRKQMEGFIFTDGNNMAARRDYMNTSFSSPLVGMSFNFPSSYQIRLKSAMTGSGTEDFVVQPMTLPKYNEAQPQMKSKLRFEWDAAGHTGIIRIGSFVYYDRVDFFKKFLDSCFLQLKLRKSDQLIIDLRGNDGGDPFCSSYVLAYLSEKPVSYFAKSYDGYDNLAKPIPLATNHFTGKVYILTDGYCFSSTGHLCALLRYHHLGHFIGTQTDGTYTCNDNAEVVSLNKTGLMIRIPRDRFDAAVQGIPRFIGISPDELIEPDIESALAGKDTVMNFAINKANNTP
jgi:hypothetical protein